MVLLCLLTFATYTAAQTGKFGPHYAASVNSTETSIAPLVYNSNDPKAPVFAHTRWSDLIAEADPSIAGVGVESQSASVLANNAGNVAPVVLYIGYACDQHPCPPSAATTLGYFTKETGGSQIAINSPFLNTPGYLENEVWNVQCLDATAMKGIPANSCPRGDDCACAPYPLGVVMKRAEDACSAGGPCHSYNPEMFVEWHPVTPQAEDEDYSAIAPVSSISFGGSLLERGMAFPLPWRGRGSRG
jgi:hypothetical protein